MGRGLAVVLVNWNQEADTTECLRSLEKVTAPGVWIILVDNGSEPASVGRLEAAFPRVAVVRLGDNRGFTGGNNVGIARALDEGADHVMLLNNDTLVEPGFVEPLLAALAEPGVGVVGPKILYHPEVDRIWFAGGIVDWRSGRQYHLGAEALDGPDWSTPRDVDYVTACCMAAPADLFRAVGGLDDRYFIYFEETDWNLRVARRGLRRRYVPGARVFHKVSRAMKTGSPISDYYFARNRLLFFRSHAPGLARVRLIALYTARSLRFAQRLRRAGRHAKAAAVTAGVAHFYRGRFGRCPLVFGTDG